MKRRDFLKFSCLTATAGIASCTKVYRSSRPPGVLREKENGLLARLEELKMDAATLVYAKRGPLLLVRKKDSVKAYDSICPHTMCELNDGYKEQPLVHGEVRCWIHDSYFDSDTGGYLSGPANPKGKLPEVLIRIENGMIYLEV